MNNMQALQAFWEGFGLPAYDNNTVPDNAEKPYITYEASDGYFGDELAQTANVYYRSTSWADITQKVKEIGEVITRGGKNVPYDGGGFHIKLENPWAIRMRDPNDDAIRWYVLNYSIEFIQ